ncbi:unnamed protein product [Arctia plantaginis]|uniref:Uncharacterized protein n=1 Tax=Arctia plantaginis TaxID=874455 RepID=A0A8S1ADV4_ARCPL|nr:unnamed protein product [Arctia plantaginis]
MRRRDCDLRDDRGVPHDWPGVLHSDHGVPRGDHGVPHCDDGDIPHGLLERACFHGFDEELYSETSRHDPDHGHDADGFGQRLQQMPR